LEKRCGTTDWGELEEDIFHCNSWSWPRIAPTIGFALIGFSRIQWMEQRFRTWLDLALHELGTDVDPSTG